MEENKTIEILGENLDKVMSLYISAKKTFQGDLASRKDKQHSWNLQVWDITESDLDKLNELEHWEEDFGWFRTPEGSVLGPCTKKNIIINGKSLLTWGHTKEVINDAWTIYIDNIISKELEVLELQEWADFTLELDNEKKEYIYSLIDNGDFDLINVSDKEIILKLSGELSFNYANIFDYIGENFRVSSESNVLALIKDLAKYNNITQKELMENYGG